MVSTILNRLRRRLRIGYRFLKCFKGLTLKSFLNLYVSVVLDILLYCLSTRPFNLRILTNGIYLIKPHGIYVFARRLSDDLYYCLPYREKYVESIIKYTLKDGDIFVDVGANVGYFSLLASRKVGMRGLVIAFEPVPTTYRVFLMNLKLNNVKNVRPYNLAVWSKSKKLRIVIPKGLFSLASIVCSKQLYKGKFIRTYVTAVTLDGILDEYRKIKMIKIYAEGSEYQILKGSLRTLQKTQYIIVELTLNIRETLKLLRNLEFKIQRLGKTNYVLAYHH